MIAVARARSTPAPKADRARDGRRRDLAPLQDAVGWRFENIELLERALTHASAATRARPDNERLEFLGDRVLGLLTAEALCERRPNADEGELAPRFNALVRKETCADVAEAIDLGPLLRLSKSEASTGGRRKQAVLGDAVEALIAAIYLDGGIDAARRSYLKLWGPRLDDQPATAPIDAKTALQEWAQARGEPVPRYALVDRSGPDHAPVFTVSVAIADGRSATAEGPSKRAAEQSAAGALLALATGAARAAGGDDD